MITATKFFILTDVQHDLITKRASFVSQSTFTDWYYDYPDWHLSLNDIWLRKRPGFEIEFA